MDTKPHAFSLPFVRHKQVAKDTFSFYFDRSQENWKFHPGQYIQLILPHEHADDMGTMRYFSISSSPLDKNYLRIITKVSQSSFKKTLFSLSKGQEVSFFGPNGIFYLQEQKPSHVMLAGGIGITPFISMLEYAAAKRLKQKITLLVSFSTFEELIFVDHLSKISRDFANINVVFTITHPEKSWKGETGRISTELIKKHIPDSTKTMYYVTGSPPMVEATVKIVEEMGILEDDILQEHFSGY